MCLVLIITGTTLANSQNLQQELIDLVQFEGQVPAVQIDGVLDMAGFVSTSLVPGEEARYTVSFTAPVALELKDATLSLDLPDSFSIFQNGILDENPGCTLANLQYKNKDTDKYWSFLQGQAEVNTQDNQTIFTLHVQSIASASVNAGRTIYLTLPGVVNAPDEGAFPVHILLQSTTGNYEGQTASTLGMAPAEAPSNLEVKAASSYQLDAEWDPVEGASRYQLFYALDPHGDYIQAYDFGKDPNPGQQSELAVTSCMFTAKGNGGLEPGRTYYFKVRAGNQYGFGPFSKVIKSETPVLRLKAPEENLHSPIIVRADQEVKIVDEDLILLFITATGEPVAAELTAEGSTISISAELESGTSYQVVIYPNALVNTGDIETNNNLFGFEFVAGSQPSK